MKNVTKTTQKIARIRLEEKDSPEISLWKAIICQAIEDALMTSKNQRKICMRRRAIEWLTTESEDLSFICFMAGINKERLSDYLKIIIKNRD